jgi:predicted phosphoadenosine phosphosulfate sulfurtransferase
MRIYKPTNVFDAALDRMRFLFDEFDEVVVSTSGGKDSTVVYNLALMVAKERNRLPLKVFFLDQEAEWMMVIEYVRKQMYRPEVMPIWYQVPFRMFNATSTSEHWLEAWGPGLQWMRPKEPISIQENKTGCDRFHEMFGTISKTEFPGKKMCLVAGVRCEESPTRFMGLTHYAKYKWVTWGKTLDKKTEQYTFYPIYDWSLSDVWKAIYDNQWEYCKLYDHLYRYGLQPVKMRVSNVHHETAVSDLFRLQEIEPDTYQRLCKRIAGIDMAGKMGKENYFVTELPYMFSSWKEYRDFLLEKLITDEKWVKTFRKRFERMENDYAAHYGDSLFQLHINSILTNDWEGIKLDNFERNPAVNSFKKGETHWNRKIVDPIS